MDKAFSKVETKSCYQTQTLSVTENDFLFLIRQKKRFFEKFFFYGLVRLSISLDPAL